MGNDTTSGAVAQDRGIDFRNTLVTKIALFLNYLNKIDYQKLVRYFNSHPVGSETEILKFMVVHKLINPQDVAALKKACLNFAKAQEDTRFGSLCIQFEFLTQSNLVLALEEQKRMAAGGSNIFLGDLLVDAGMLSERQRKLILQKQKIETGMRDPKAAAAEETFREIHEPGITFLISHDALNAYAVKTGQFNSSMSVETVKELLENNGIIYGMVPETTLEEFIRNEIYHSRRLQVAKGLFPVAGTDAAIEYKFEEDFLKAGSLMENGAIDFKDRGEIPNVVVDDVLAVKTPVKPGRDGINIFGDVVPAPEPVDLPLKNGKGARLSGDGLTAIADRNGFPRINRQGKVAVNEAYFIKGDVDYNTGHIKSEQSVFITGTIKNGFEVEAVDVVAKAIDGGTIRSKGNVIIQNGVTNADIDAQGNVTAGHIQSSTIACIGDMLVNKEVVDTRISMEGTFKMLRGKMFSSTLHARGGARVWQVGSEKARPCTISVGFSHYLEQTLNALDKEVEKNQTGFESKSLERSLLQKELEQIKADISGDKGADQSPPDIQALMVKKQEAELKLESVTNQVTAFANTLKQCVKEKFQLKKLDKEIPSKPILDVNGKLISRTRINGRYTKLIVSADMARVRVMEIANKNAAGQIEGWEMVTTRL